MNSRAILAAGAALCAVGANAATSAKPNIILIMTDQQRADLTAREGYPLDVTPFVDQLAQRGAWFDKAYTVSPASSPARCSMLTGRYPSATKVYTNHNIPDVRFETDIIEVLNQNGYKKAMVGKNHAYLTPAMMDFWSAYGHWGRTKKNLTEAEQDAVDFLQKQARGQWLEPSPVPLEEQMPVKIVNDALSWIKKQNDNPYFAWVSFPEPHNPYQVCEPYYSLFDPADIPAPRTSRSDLAAKGEKYEILASLEDESCPDLGDDMRRIQANYLGMVRLIDDQIKRLVETLEKRDDFENTIIIVLSDHGDYFGEYGLVRKGAGVPDCLTRIPMVWCGGAVEQHDAVMDAHVSIADVFPTLCSAMGVEIPVGVQGRSLWSMLRGEEYPESEFANVVVQQGYGGEDISKDESLSFEDEGCLTNSGIVGNFDELNTWTQSGARRMIREDDWKLIVDSYGACELYNLADDPSEVNNLYEKSGYEAVGAKLMARMMAWEIRLQDPLPTPRKRYHFKKNENNYHFIK